ncbi:ATP-dependent zinc metalloprotease FtsH [Dehalococcoidia bacterium]|nr:ATP-dependent zinc metalloprotease FtsH [Dehalococcoidia bacterium]
MKLNMSRNSVILLIAIALLAAILVTVLQPPAEEPRELALNEVISMAKAGEILEIVVRRTALEITTIDQEKQTSTIGEATDLLEVFHQEGIPISGAQAVTIRFEEETGFAGTWFPVLLNFLPLILFGGLLFFLLRRAAGGPNQAMGFARSKARMFSGDKPTVTFSDVAGVAEAKEELQEVVDFLSNSEKFLALGARIPRGVLLVGPPGTGKTLLSRAVAGEAGVPFFSISGSEFVEMFVGVGAARVRDLFDQAKRHAPCIVFVDEIDAVGRHRGAGLGGGHDEREQTLNQILSEMDGFDTNTNVIVLAATNRPDILDPALLRPGRFDRRVVLDQPDINGRKAILEVHSQGKPLDSAVDLGVIARQTPGFSGADLSNLINEAAILAARRGKKDISLVELEESIDRVIAGPERRSRLMSRKEKEITAYHEAGHALVARMLPNVDPVHKISIIARGMMAGYTRQLPTEDRYLVTRSQFNDMLATLLGGHTAEEIIFDEMTTGSQNDIERATKIARMMVTEYGMSDKLGPRTFGKREELVFLGKEISEQRDYSDKVAEDIDAEVHDIIDRAYNVAQDILTKNKAKLIQIAERLMAEETLEGKTLDALFDSPLPSPAPA